MSTFYLQKGVKYVGFITNSYNPDRVSIRGDLYGNLSREEARALWKRMIDEEGWTRMPQKSMSFGDARRRGRWRWTKSARSRKL